MMVRWCWYNGSSARNTRRARGPGISFRPVKTAYTGTLSDAKGPISAKVSGNELNIRYKTKDGLDVEQWLFLQPGGETAVNHMVVRKLGVTVASLEETIRKIN